MTQRERERGKRKRAMLRSRFNRIINGGVNIVFIAKEANVPRSSFTYWLKGERELQDKYIEQLMVWLEEYKKYVAET